MKLRWVVPAFLVASILAVPVALGRDAGERADACPKATYVLRGSYTATAGDAISLTVERANRRGRALVGEVVPVEVTKRTKVRRNGRAALDDLVAGDHVNVLARGCRVAEAGPAGLRLVARRIVARPADADELVVDDPVAR